MFKPTAEDVSRFIHSPSRGGGQHGVMRAVEAAVKILLKSPTDCSAPEIGAYTSFVLAGGEVATTGLFQRINSASALVFGFVENALAGIAALKVPIPSYRSRISRSSGFKLTENTFPFELGWVYVREPYRGRKLSVQLASAASNAAVGHGVFATSAVENVAMHATLRHLGFAEAGTPYASGSRAIQVFTRAPA